jgi:hypothetical protein
VPCDISHSSPPQDAALLLVSSGARSAIEDTPRRCQLDGATRSATQDVLLLTGSMTTSPQEPGTQSSAGYALRGGGRADGTIVRGRRPEFVRVEYPDRTADVYKPTGERDKQQPDFERYDFEPTTPATA